MNLPLLPLALAALAVLPKLTPCHLKGLTEQARCGTLEVFEDRAGKTGRKITLSYAVLPALASSPEPDPVFYLAGGPGQSAIDLAGFLFPAVERIHQRRDLVFLDQRGTGKSNPLDCELISKNAPLAEELSAELRLDRWQACLDTLQKKADLRLYSTPIAMDDLDDVRAALGYEKINLWGTSYGTRAALVYLRQHPDRVRSAILDGVAPLSLILPLNFSSDAERALQLVFEHCEKDAACNAAYPKLSERFLLFLDRVKTAPIRAHVLHPLSGAPEDVELSFEIFSESFRSILYSPEATSLLPLILDRAEKNDFGPFLATHHAMSSTDQGSYKGMSFSVICTEDAPQITEEEIHRWTDGSKLGDSLIRQFLSVCRQWPKGQVDASYYDPVSSPAPILLLSGELDPVTPPSWAEDAKKTLPHATSVVVPGAGHLTMGSGCVRRLMSDFLDQLRTEGLDADCTRGLSRPPFFVSFAGPTP